MKKHIKQKATQTNPKDKSPYVFQKDKIGYQLRINEFPWSPKQQELIDLISAKETKVCFIKGPAGTAKTLLAVHAALHAMNEKKIGELIYIRQPVESSKHTLGFLKGGLEEKLQPYLQPLQDKLQELLTKSDIDKLTKEERIVGVPIGHLRGRSFNVNYIIVDEAQNLTKEDMLLVMTRLGKFSKIIFCGDIMQSDINKSAYLDTFNRFDDEKAVDKGIITFTFGKEDIFRNEILSFIIERFETP